MNGLPVNAKLQYKCPCKQLMYTINCHCGSSHCFQMIINSVSVRHPVSVRYSFTHNKIFDRRNPCSPRKSVEVCFYWRWYVCLSVCACVSVTTITKNIVDGYVPNFMGRFQWENGRPSLCFVTIGSGDVAVTVKKQSKPAIVYILYF